jgi:AAHS family 4-hydroxybenzoate transporter-like MFS transporter
MADHGIDVHEELASAKVSGFHVRLGLIMGLLTLFDGYDTFNPAYVIHYVAGPWGLQGAQIGLLISSGLIGFLIGSAVHGIVADRFGRRGTLLGGLWITSIFTLLTALFADSFLSFCALRLCTGLGLGVLLPLATTYINELAPRRVTNTFALWGVRSDGRPAARPPAWSACSPRPPSAGRRCTGSDRCLFCCFRSCTRSCRNRLNSLFSRIDPRRSARC